jgi:CRISPR-associated endonuclease/helicase Cas3
VTFSQYFQTIWGRDRNPFPWQEELAKLALQGQWPAAIGLPTAAGKTALIDIAVFALAMRAPNAARRIFFVVDRRVIVDEAAERAEGLAKAFAQAIPGSELGALAQSLRDLGGGEAPLITATLRGGRPREDWVDSPLQPMIVCSTVDQIGSSLLFRAYGASEYARPIRAGLAAHDSLIILDEAHTSQPFAETLGWIGRYRRWAEERLDLPFTVVEMSATPRGENWSHDLARDLADPILKKRWKTEKRAKLALEEQGPGDEDEFFGLVKGLVREARTLRDQRGARVIGVIANRIWTARRVHQELERDGDSTAILLTGRARPWDRDEVWKKWRPRIGAGRKETPIDAIFVVATQCIEVGANLDFDGLVTEIASMDAIEQRFGRLAREGSDAVRYAAIVAAKGQILGTYADPIYSATLRTTWRWLKDQVRKEERMETIPDAGKKKAKPRKIKEEFVPMGVWELRRALAETDDPETLMMPRRSAPVLLPAHMDLLCQTSPEPAISPEPAVLLHGPESGPADVQVVWRQDLEAGQDLELWKDIVAICPPSAAETIAVPVWAVRKWLFGQAARELSDLEGTTGDESRSGTGKGPVLAWRGEEESEVLPGPEAIRPGMTIVVPTEYGGCDPWGWNPESADEVLDIGDAVKLEAGQAMLRFHPKLAERWKYAELAQRTRESETAADARRALSGPLDPDAADWVKEAVSLLAVRRSKLVENPADEGESWAAVIDKGTFEQGDTRACFTVEIPLDQHLAGCMKLAEVFARGLPERIRRTVVRAVELHDIGKADPRFQAWLRGGNPIKLQEPLAKSGKSGQNRRAVERARELARYPKGGRHELMSLALVAQREEDFRELDFDLLLHLIACHHGRCRPLAPVVEDGEPVEVTYNGWSARSDHRLERAGSGISERFWRLTRRYGWYGLSLLETLVRLSDQRRSEEEQLREAAEAAHA